MCRLGCGLPNSSDNQSALLAQIAPSLASSSLAPQLAEAQTLIPTWISFPADRRAIIGVESQRWLSVSCSWMVLSCVDSGSDHATSVSAKLASTDDAGVLMDAVFISRCRRSRNFCCSIWCPECSLAIAIRCMGLTPLLLLPRFCSAR